MRARLARGRLQRDPQSRGASFLLVGALEFWSNVVDSLAWPLTVATAVLVLQNPIGRVLEGFVGMLGRATKFSAGLGSGQIAMELAEELREENNESTQDDAEAPADETPADSSKVDKIFRLLAVDPRAAMLFVFVDVEGVARNVAAEFEPVRSAGFLSFNDRMKILRRHGLSDSAYRSARYLWGIRNELVHGQGSTISANEASEFVRLALELERSIRLLPMSGDTNGDKGSRRSEGT